MNKKSSIEPKSKISLVCTFTLISTNYKLTNFSANEQKKFNQTKISSLCP